MNTGLSRSIREEISEDLAVYRDSFILERLAGIRELSEDKVRRRMDILGIHSNASRYLVVLYAPYLMNLEAEHIDKTLVTIARIISRGYEKAGLESYIVTDTYCNVSAVLGLNSEEDLSLADKITEVLADAIIKQCDVKMFVGMGRPVELFSNIHKSKEMAKEALAYKFSFASNNVVHAKDVERIYHPSMIRYEDYVDRVLGCFYDGNMQLLKIRVEELISVISTSFEDPLNSFKSVCIEMTAMISQRGREIGVLSLGDKAEVYKGILEMESMEELSNWFVDMCDAMTGEISQQRIDKNGQMVDMAINYIENNLQDNELSLQSISDYVSLSTTYFSRIFFQKTNVHVTEYVNNKRIEKAKNLLVNTNEKVSAIAEMVGFMSPNYFNNVFKNATGITPLKYRLMMKM